MLSPAGNPVEGKPAVIVVFGSINIDVVVPVPHLPKAGETVLGSEYALLPGGKGANQALAARRAGAAVVLAGAVGKDVFATLALANLREAGVDLSLVRRVRRPSGLAAIMVGAEDGARGENVIALAPGANRDVAAASVPDALLGPGTVVVCQMEVPPAETMALVARARARGACTILNLAPALPIDPARLADVDLLIANQGEAAALASDPAALAGRLGRAFVVTRGEAGATAFLAAGGGIEIPALMVAPVDTTGAGDGFVGVLAAGLDAGLALAPALRRASAAAGLACLAGGAQGAMPDGARIAAAAARLPV